MIMFILTYLAIGCVYTPLALGLDPELRYELRGFYRRGDYFFGALFIAFGIAAWLPSLIIRYRQ